MKKSKKTKTKEMMQDFPVKQEKTVNIKKVQNGHIINVYDGQKDKSYVSKSAAETKTILNKLL